MELIRIDAWQLSAVLSFASFMFCFLLYKVKELFLKIERFEKDYLSNFTELYNVIKMQRENMKLLIEAYSEKGE